MQPEQREITEQELAKHNKDGDAWLAIDGIVYDVSKFARLHPGGRAFIMTGAGKDCSKDFWLYHGPASLEKYQKKLAIGRLAGYEPHQMSPLAPAGAFGDMVPFADPGWYQRLNSPYYDDSHRAWRKYVREFVDANVLPGLTTWVHARRPPKDLLLKMGAAGLLAGMSGPPYQADYVPQEVLARLPIDPKKYDYFHEFILHDEFARCGVSSAFAALTNGPAIALSAIMAYGTPEQKNRYAPEVYAGRKMIALAISEPNAGSDVAGMQCKARREGDVYIVNGNKKWITNGTYADFFVTLVNTSNEGGQGSKSFLVVERDTPGFKVRKVNVRGSEVSGTAYLDFDNARVPASALIGKEGQGFQMVMHNFNHERWYLVVTVLRMCRICIDQSIKYALKRKTFGKTLSQHQSIRMKIAAMIRGTEQLHAWCESLTYQMKTMDHQEAMLKLGDQVALCKVQASKTYEYIARETTHIFGGNSMMVGGPGQLIEPTVSQVKGYAIPGGAEDVLDDFAARTAFKMAKLMAKL